MNDYERSELEAIKTDLLRAEKQLRDALATVSFALVEVNMLVGRLNPETIKADLHAALTPRKSTPVITFPPAPPKVIGKPVEPIPDEPLVINKEWETVLDALNNGKEHLFVTGEAGTGKSTLLNHFVDHFNGNAAIVAPTGVAALRVGGETIHRFFGLGAHALEEDDAHELSGNRKAVVAELDTLVVDEISMVRPDLMDAVQKALQINRKDKTKPFGGCRVVMFGDLYQLPPVVKEKQEKQWMEQRYGTAEGYFFHSACFRDQPPKIHALTEVFRQKDPVFMKALNAVRDGTLTKEQLDLLNERVQPNFKPTGDDLWITLTTTNDAANAANLRMLRELPGMAQSFEAVITDDFDLKNAPTDVSLELKEGAAVLFIRNNKSKGYVNGTLGKVTSLSPLWVEIDGGEVEVEPETWENIRYEFDPVKKKLTRQVVGKFVQVPLKLASAITVHRSQGVTLDRAIIDLGNGAFAAGQSYVAISRCRTLEGLVLKRPLRMDDLIVSTEVRHFLSGKEIAKPIATQAAQMALIKD